MDSIEVMAKSHGLDGLVLVTNCDKIIPGMAMAALELNIPAVMISGGPTGGSLSSVRTLKQVAVCTDPVAADAWGASLLDLGPADLPYLDVAVRLRLGTTDWTSILEKA